LTWYRIKLYQLASGKGKSGLADRPIAVLVQNLVVYSLTAIALFVNVRIALLPLSVASLVLGLWFIYGPLRKYQNLKDINCSTADRFKWVCYLVEREREREREMIVATH
jgi:hypothetical protein